MMLFADRAWDTSPSFQGVAAGSVATAQLATNLTYHRLAILHANAVSSLTRIEVLANGSVIHSYTGLELNMLMQYYGRTAGALGGYLIIDFDRRGIKSRAGEELSGIGTMLGNPEINPNPITQLTVKVTFDATAAPSLTMWAETSAATPAGVVRKVRPYTHSPSGAGELQISDFPKGDILLAGHFGSALITSLKVVVDQRNRHNLPKGLADIIVDDGYENRSAQGNYYHWDPAVDGHGSLYLETRSQQDLRFVIAVSAATTINTLLEYMGPVAR